MASSNMPGVPVSTGTAPIQRRESGGPVGGMGHHSNVHASTTPVAQPASSQNLNQIVIEYLNKKGYSKTEAMLRQESANVDMNGRAIVQRAEDQGGRKYFTAFNLLHQWVDDNLEIYKAELRRLLWPVFVYSYLSLIIDHYTDMAGPFFDDHRKEFAREREEDLRSLEFVRHLDHISENATAKAYKDNRYRLTLTNSAYFALIQFLESKERQGGSVINGICQNFMHIVKIDRAVAGNDRAFAVLMARMNGEDDIPDEDEGIPGHNPGSANTDRHAPQVLTKVALGPLPLESEMEMDVRDELEEEDVKHPPASGQNSLIEELDQKIKREPSEDAPSRDQVPLPKPLARDVAMEVQRIKENRDRFKIEPRTSGVGAGISVTMFTFHNTFDSINCIDFSGDNKLVAVGTAESYIRIWSLEGKSLPSLIPNDTAAPNTSSRRLIGHSGPVYAVSFSPSAANDGPESALTSSRYLISASVDKTIRLWSLDTWTNLVVYKGHDHPVWDVKWGPFGHYFVSGSQDRTARIWSTDQISPLRILVGHDQDVDCVSFHPNNAYVFTGSSDKTVRMWDVNRGSAVRLFTGHTANITCVSCAPSGKTLASADDSGTILLWDIATGRRVKRMRGHGKGGIWSISWSVESSLLVSGGADNTVRVWDVLLPLDGLANKTNADGSKLDGGTINPTTSVPGVVAHAKKGRGKDASISPDQISAFPTKKSPVYQVQFTNMNLVLAGGAYMP